VEAATVELDGQYRATREGVGFLPRERAQLVASGADAIDYLQGQLTNDVEALEPGGGSYSALLDRKGRMQGDMRVLVVAPDEVWIDTEPEAAPAILRHLQMYKVGREVEIDDVSDERAIVSLIGPGAENALGIGPVGPEHSHREFEAGVGAPCRALATDLGVDVLCPAAAVEALAERLASAGAPPITEAAAEIVRVESGRPRFGREMTTETIPQEAGINERAVSFTKGCYIGQETVARLHYKGKPNRHLRGLRLEAAVDAGAPIVLDERELGRVGTAALSPALGPIALAIVRREAQPGARVTVGDGVTAEVVDLPFGTEWSGSGQRQGVRQG
jgi:tRNA-modifying protein YgfZ